MSLLLMDLMDSWHGNGSRICIRGSIRSLLVKVKKLYIYINYIYFILTVIMNEVFKVSEFWFDCTYISVSYCHIVFLCIILFILNYFKFKLI